MERFWQVEEGPPYTNPFENDEICEREFIQTHRRNPEGRFEVRLPLRGDVKQLGSSLELSIKRLKSMERKFIKYPELQARYVEFMHEYKELGHMTEVTNETGNEVINYLPHHAVIKEDNATTKLRVVFNGSSPTSSGVSLNDILRVGSTMQQDLLHILLRFRQHRYIITADVQKIYRQIILQEDQRDLQRILWRQDPREPIRQFQLNTVTDGLTSAPYLATRCLLQLANENQDRYPQASDIT